MTAILSNLMVAMPLRVVTLVKIGGDSFIRRLSWCWGVFDVVDISKAVSGVRFRSLDCGDVV